MTQISFWHPAGDNERFASHSWDGQAGKQVPVKGPEREDLGLCTLISAEVAEDGSGVTLTIELPEACGPVTSPAAGGISFAFAEPGPEPELRDPLSVKPPRIAWKA